MIDRLIDFSLRQPFYIAGAIATLIAGGLYAVWTLPFEAFPDLTANSVSVIADAPGMAPGDVEQLVTYPIERSLLGLPNTESVRSTTKFGLSMTQVVFADGVDPYFARQVVAERLNDLDADLPEGASVTMGPVATAMGEIFQFVLVSDDPSVTAWDLKRLQDYSIAPQLRTVSGVAEVNSWGGLVEQYHVIVQPGRLIQAGLTLADVEEALAANNRNFGGTYTEARGERFVGARHGPTGEPFGHRGRRDRHAGRRADPHPRRRDGHARLPAASGCRDASTARARSWPAWSSCARARTRFRVLARVEDRVEEMLPTLPDGVRMVTFYNQGDLVEQTTHTVQKNLLPGRHARGGPALGIPAQPHGVGPRGAGHSAVDALGVRQHAHCSASRRTS